MGRWGTPHRFFPGRLWRLFRRLWCHAFYHKAVDRYMSVCLTIPQDSLYPRCRSSQWIVPRCRILSRVHVAPASPVCLQSSIGFHWTSDGPRPLRVSAIFGLPRASGGGLTDGQPPGSKFNAVGRHQSARSWSDARSGDLRATSR